MGRPSLREQILESGVQTLYRNAFGTIGVRGISAAAGVPQGSFTNHFRSKEHFGAEVLERYFGMMMDVASATLSDKTRKPIDRLHAYFEAITTRLEGVDWHHGCLIGNMALEASEHSDLLRQRLGEIFGRWPSPFADAIRAAQNAGEIRADVDAEDVADMLLGGWQGAMLRMKVDRTRAPLDRFRRVFFALLATPGDNEEGE